MNVPFYNLALQNQIVADEVKSIWHEILRKNAFVLGNIVQEFEEAYAIFSNAKFCVGVANGTDAIELLLRSLELERDQKVLIPAHTFIATALAVSRAGMEFDLCDVDEKTMLMTLSSVKSAELKNIGCIVPVNMYGQMVDSNAISQYVGGSIKLVEDGAQSQGAKFQYETTSSHVLGTATSFYPGKNLGAFGDAGAITTDSEQINMKVRILRNYGSEIKYFHPEVGFNSRLDSMQAAVLLSKLHYLAEWNEQRRALADGYLSALRDVKEVKLPEVDSRAVHAWHLFVIRVKNRDKVQIALREKGVETIIHYPSPIHLHGAFRHMGYARGDFPISEAIADECLSLPLFPGMSPSEQEYVIEKLLLAIRMIN